jgi:hypothetical protein
MTNAIVGKVVNMTISRTSAIPTWSTWLGDWVREDGAKVQVQRIQTMPEEFVDTSRGKETDMEPDFAEQ